MTPRAYNERFLALLALLGLAGLYLLAPWPGPQAVLHVLLVFGVAPAMRTYLNCAIAAAMAGWVLETALRAYPGMGGTALGNMVCAVALWYMLTVSPPEKPFVYYLQLVLAVMLHTIIVHFFVTIASGPHPWGHGWQWAIVLLPLWGPMAWKLYTPPHMR